MNQPQNYRERFDAQIAELFRTAWLQALMSPGRAWFFLSTLRHQRRAARLRRDQEANGIHVPPLMIVSVTDRCNLNCRGCYARALRHASADELPVERFRGLLTEARELGVSIVMLAGGEPLLRPDILAATRDYPEVVFPVFTNGTLVDDHWVERFRCQRNLIAVASIEGAESETDARRGDGVYSRLKGLAERVRRSGIFWGCSLTVTGSNLAALTESEFVRRLVQAGCGAFFFVEYVPVQPETKGLVLSASQKQVLMTRLEELRTGHQALFIAFPGDESQFGGCLAAGRGFVHTSATGSVEACPFAPFSDTSLRDATLRDALQSPLLALIRNNHDRLKETGGGCALWAEREWVASLAGHPKRPGG